MPVVTVDWTHHPLTVRQYQLFCLYFMYFIYEVYGFGFLLDLPISPRCVLISVFFITLHRFSSPVTGFHRVYFVGIIAWLFSGLWFLAAAKSSFWFLSWHWPLPHHPASKRGFLHNKQCQYITSQHCTFDKYGRKKAVYNDNNTFIVLIWDMLGC